MTAVPVFRYHFEDSMMIFYDDLRASAIHGKHPEKIFKHKKYYSNMEDSRVSSIAVIGAGSFGTALAQVAARSGHNVKLYARNKDVVDGINKTHRNIHYLSDFELYCTIEGVNSVQDALDGVDFAILAIPTQLVRQFVSTLK